ncbi:hypothetical protein PQQ84_24005 [Paraburkholderia strydomiana]|uniref:hypothetical protein n=1 Tax=Paraburkholderia strydomiana TaxID=1245417 RepID=UPI0038BCC01E
MIYLASEASAFMTGSDLMIDGGLHRLVNARERMLSETHIWNGNLTCRNRQ